MCEQHRRTHPGLDGPADDRPRDVVPLLGDEPVCAARNRTKQPETKSRTRENDAIPTRGNREAVRLLRG